MKYGIDFLNKALCYLALFFSYQVFATEPDNQLHIHVHYQQEHDTWQVQYQLPIAVDHIAFERQSNFDRTKLYKLDKSKFFWDKAGDVLLIRSLDGSNFKSFNLTFSSYYNFIQKDYTHNIKYSDGSVLLYTNHLALGANIIDDKAISAFGASFHGTQFHFYGPKQNIVFLGNNYQEKAQWQLEGEGTYVYFGNIKPIESDNMIAIIDPALPKWAWNNTQKYFPKLFDFYKNKTGQPLIFKPVVFFNYDQVTGDYANYSGGTLDGLVQLTINGKRWESENEEQFNMLFHFLAHEAAHFWNGQMFSFEDEAHSWMHEGGADTFANFAMLEFGLIDSKQMMQKFESATNQCLLNKEGESLEQSAKLWRYGNYYSCGAAMGLASHFAIKAKDSSKSVFDVWKNLFQTNINDRLYNQQDYFAKLSQLTGSKALASAFDKFSRQTNVDNRAEIMSWFESTELNITPSEDYPSSAKKHWGKKILTNLMKMHCESFSFNSYDTFVKTYPIDHCTPFQQSMEVQYINNLGIFNDSIKAYNLFREKCESGDAVILQNREKAKIAEINCLHKVPSLEPYIKLEQKL